MDGVGLPRWDFLQVLFLANILGKVFSKKVGCVQDLVEKFLSHFLRFQTVFHFRGWRF
jgi:hypothetical protein